MENYGLGKRAVNSIYDSLLLGTVWVTYSIIAEPSIPSYFLVGVFIGILSGVKNSFKN